MTVIAFIIGYYLLFYVKGREEDFVEKKFRILDLIGKNLVEKKKNLDFIANLNFNSLQKNDKKGNTPIQNITSDPFDKIIRKHTDATAAPLSTDKLYWLNTLTSGDQLLQEIPFASFISNLLHKTDFEEFIVIQIRKSLNENHDPKVIYKTFEPQIDRVHIDSIIRHTTARLKITDHSILILKGIHYKSFIQQVAIPDVTGDSNNWMLVGLVKESNFRSSTRSIDTWALVQLSMIALFLLLSMPLIKLWVMNIYERLQVSNVLFSGIAIIVGTAVIVLLLFSLYDFTYDKSLQKEGLEKIACQIESRFTNELRQLYCLLSKVKNPNAFSELSTSEGPDSSGKFVDNLYSESIDKSLLQRFEGSPYFNEILWLGANGRADLVLSTHDLSEDIILPDVGSRDYYKHVIEKKYWQLDRGKQFTLQSIFSRVNNQPEVGFGIANGDKVLAVATRMFSMMNVLMPPGHTFCITDETGKVLFHSTSNYNLQENIVEEIESAKLGQSIVSRVAFDGVVKYHNLQHYMYGKPIHNLPLYLVVLKQQKYYTTPLTLTATFAATFMILLFGLQALQLLLLFLVSYRNSKLKLRRFFLNWMRPRTGEAYCSLYYQQTIVFICVIVYQIICICFWYDHVSVILLFMVSPLYCAAWMYYKIKSVRTNFFKKNSHILFAIFSLLFTLLINIIFFNYIDNTELVLSIVFQIGLIFIFVVSNYFAYSSSSQSAYTILIFLWLVSVSITPIALFYKAGHFHQNQVWSRYLLWEATRKLEAHTNSQRATLNTIVSNNIVANQFSDEKENTIDRSNYLFSNNEIMRVPYMKPDSSLFIENRFNLFLKSLYPAYDSLLIKSYRGTDIYAHDHSWFTRSSKDAVFLSNTSRTLPLTVAHISPLLNFGYGPYGLFFMLTLVAMLWFIYVILRFTINRIYGNSSYTFTPPSLRSSFALDILPELKSVFYVSLPGSNMSAVLEVIGSHYATDRIDFRNEDLLKVPTCSNKVIIIEGLEYNLQDVAFLKRKLDFIKNIKVSPALLVIIHSCHSPSFILESMENRLKDLDVKKFDKEFQVEYNGIALHVWEYRSLLCDFVTIYNPLLYNNTNSSAADDPTWLYKDLSIGCYLPQFKNSLQLELHDREPEDQILLIAERFDSYYQSIWNCLSREERFILYDLAKDRYVNLKNKKAISRLMQLGLIRKEDVLRVMNDSFGEFILAITSDVDKEAMELQAHKRGTWSSVQLVLILIVVGLGAFLALTQQQFFNQLNTILTAVGASMVLLLKFGGIFSGGSNK